MRTVTTMQPQFNLVTFKSFVDHGKMAIFHKEISRHVPSGDVKYYVTYFRCKILCNLL